MFLCITKCTRTIVNHFKATLLVLGTLFILSTWLFRLQPYERLYVLFVMAVSIFATW